MAVKHPDSWIIRQKSKHCVTSPRYEYSVLFQRSIKFVGSSWRQLRRSGKGIETAPAPVRSIRRKNVKVVTMQMKRMAAVIEIVHDYVNPPNFSYITLWMLDPGDELVVVPRR